MSKFKNIQVGDIHLYLMDDDGNTLRDESGAVKMFTVNDKFDLSFFIESLTPDDLEEMEDDGHGCV